MGVLFIMMLHLIIPHDHIHVDGKHHSSHEHHHSHDHDSGHSHGNDNNNFAKKVLSSFPVTEHSKTYHSHQFVHLNHKRQILSKNNTNYVIQIKYSELMLNSFVHFAKFLKQPFLLKNIKAFHNIKLLRAPPLNLNNKT